MFLVIQQRQSIKQSWAIPQTITISTLTSNITHQFNAGSICQNNAQTLIASLRNRIGWIGQHFGHVWRKGENQSTIDSSGQFLAWVWSKDNALWSELWNLTTLILLLPFIAGGQWVYSVSGLYSLTTRGHSISCPPYECITKICLHQTWTDSLEVSISEIIIFVADITNIIEGNEDNTLILKYCQMSLMLSNIL